jgi:LemA protein
MPFIYIGIGLLIFIILYVLLTFNTLVSLRNLFNEAFSTMDVYLKKRWDLIPNIVETVKGYAKHEKDTFESITALRNNIYDNMSQNEKLETNEKITESISKLMIIAESYPELKANNNFLDLSKELSKTEEDIANSRKYYNAVVRKLNDKIQMFPSNMVAALFRVKAQKMFEASENERNSVKVEL